MASKKPAKKKKPSRSRYEESNPTLSFRVKRDVYQRFKDHIRATGQSQSEFLTAALDQEEARVNARVKELAGRRDNLKQQLLSLEHLIEERRKQLEVPIQKERARRRRDLEAWYQNEKQLRKMEFTHYEIALDKIRQEVKEEEGRLRRAKFEVSIMERRKAALEEEMKKWQNEMKTVSWFINTFPWVLCNACPAASWNRMVLEVAKSIQPPMTKKAGT
ncbi:hypothetical protein ES703_48825 [subsurface metagenome]